MENLSTNNDILFSLLGLLPFLLALVAVAVLSMKHWWSKIYEITCTMKTYIFLLCIAIVWMVVQFIFLEPAMPWGGGDRYLTRAVNIVEHGVFGYGDKPTAIFPPGYSFLMVPAVLLFGDSKWVFLLTNMVVLLSASLLFRWVLLRLRASGNLANILSLLLFLYPNRLYSIMLPFSDVPFALMFMGAFACLLLFEEKPEKSLYLVLTGVFAGAAALVRSAGLFQILPLLTGVFLVGETQFLRRMLRVGLVMAVFCVVIIPWTARNYQLYQKIIPISNNGGLNLALGNNPTNPLERNSYIDSVWSVPVAWVAVGGERWNEAQQDSFYAQLGLQYIRRDPGNFLGLGVQKVGRALCTDTYTFGFLETYTNARTLIFSVLRDRGASPWFSELLYTLYRMYYAMLFVVSNFLYYVLLILTAYSLFFHKGYIRKMRWVVLLSISIVFISIFLTLGISRYKEPLSTMLLLVVSTYAISGIPKGVESEHISVGNG